MVKCARTLIFLLLASVPLYCERIAIVIVTAHVTVSEILGYGLTRGDLAGWVYTSSLR